MRLTILAIAIVLKICLLAASAEAAPPNGMPSTFTVTITGGDLAGTYPFPWSDMNQSYYAEHEAAGGHAFDIAYYPNDQYFSAYHLGDGRYYTAYDVPFAGGALDFSGAFVEWNTLDISAVAVAVPEPSIGAFAGCIAGLVALRRNRH